ncbi:MAG TPA: ChbG/HpnK family deacetylase [Bryobacteraceae bacterium]
MKRLLINADDFGFTSDVNAGIVHAHREGILSSATLMATGNAFEDAVRLARATPSLDVGCHLVLVQGRSLITGRPFPDGPQGLIPLLLKRRLDVEAELRAQLEKMIAAGIRPTHLDAHKHTHLLPVVFRTVVRLAREFRVPFVRVPFARRYYRRIARRHGVYTTDHFVGFGLTGSLTEQTLTVLLRRLPGGVTELMCHPGYLGPELKQAQTRLKESRVRELEALTSARIRALIGDLGIELASFRRAE